MIQVKIEEAYSHTFEVDTDSKVLALQKVSTAYSQGLIELEPEDQISTTISIAGENATRGRLKLKPTGRIHPQEIVGLSEISIILNKKNSTIANLRRRHADFPIPIVKLAVSPLYRVKDVLHYARRHNYNVNYGVIYDGYLYVNKTNREDI